MLTLSHLVEIFDADKTDMTTIVSCQSHQAYCQNYRIKFRNLFTGVYDCLQGCVGAHGVRLRHTDAY